MDTRWPGPNNADPVIGAGTLDPGEGETPRGDRLQEGHQGSHCGVKNILVWKKYFSNLTLFFNVINLT